MDQVVAVHPGSGAHAKCWPAERFAALVGWIETVVAGSVVLIEGPADAASVSSVLSRLERTPPVASNFPLPLQAAFFAGASLFIGNDSGLTHLAAAVHAPTIALFGPTDPAIWAPLGPHVTVVAGAGDPADPWGGVSVERVQYAIQSRWKNELAHPAGATPRGSRGRTPTS
jgi:ADP-heptose:LPS heptosyltransferase